MQTNHHITVAHTVAVVRWLNQFQQTIRYLERSSVFTKTLRPALSILFVPISTWSSKSRSDHTALFLAAKNST